jgi:uncharacterized protein
VVVGLPCSFETSFQLLRGTICERRAPSGVSVVPGRRVVDRNKETDMAEHTNVAIVRNAYEAFAKADLEGALANLADDCVFHFGGDGPNSGDHKGRDAITAALIWNFELTAGTQALDVKGIYADDDHAAVVLHETASRPDGASLAVNEVHILRLRDGKVLDLWDLPEDIQAHDDFFDGK